MHVATSGMVEIRGIRGRGFAGFARLALLVGAIVALQGVTAADEEPTEPAATPAAPPDASAPPQPAVPADIPTADLPTTEELDKFGAHSEEGGEFDRFVQRLTGNFAATFEDFADGLQSDSAKLFAVLPKLGFGFTKALFAQFAALRSRNAAAADKLAVTAKIAAILLDRRTSPTTEMQHASGFGHLSYEAMRLFQGRPADMAALRWGTYLLRRDPAHIPMTTREWRNFLTVVGGSTGVPGSEAAVTWATDELAALVKANPGDADLTKVAVILDLERGISMSPVKAASGGPLLQRALLALAPPDAIPSGDRVLVSRYNRGVTVARLYNIACKAGYRTETSNSASGLMTCELPLECGWKTVGADGDQNEWNIVREGRAGEVTLDVWKYRSDTNYVDEEGKRVGGDNLHGNLKRHFERWKGDLEKVRKAVPTVAKLSRFMPNPKGFEIIGIDHGAECRVREWYFRAEVNKLYVYNVRLIQKGGITEKDPEVAFVLESVQEKAAKK